MFFVLDNESALASSICLLPFMAEKIKMAGGLRMWDLLDFIVYFFKKLVNVFRVRP